MIKPKNGRALIAAFVFLVGLLALWARPVTADCVSCGPGGECVTAPPGYSANCECRIRSNQGTAICIPRGICDPTDASSCDGTFPQNFQNFSASKARISPQFIKRLTDKNSRLGGAVLGIIGEINDTAEAQTRSFAGTLGEAGKSFHFEAKVKPLAEGAISLAVQIEEDVTHQTEVFEGVVLDGGRSGSFSQVKRAGRAEILSWKDSL
jgi:hypothetical protein